MTDYVPEPRDRLDVPICSAIEAKNFKQALKTVEKRLAKGSDNYLLALKCFIQACHPVVSERGKAAAKVFSLLNGSPKDIPSDLAELELFEETISVLFPRSTSTDALAVGKLRAETVKSHPKEEKLALTCFQACLKRDDMGHAQQIAILLDKNFPTNHGYPYWAITTTSLLASRSNDPQRARIYSELAYKQIKNLATATSKSEEDTPSPIRSIQTSQELRLLHRLIAASGTDREKLEFLRDPRFKPGSKISKGEWIFTRQQILLLELCQEWQQLLTLCDNLLSGARATNDTERIIDARGADWLVWKAYIRSAAELEDDEFQQMVRRQIAAHVDPSAGLDKTYQRNAFLAAVEATFAFLEASEEYRLCDVECGQFKIRRVPQRVISICSYLYHHGRAPSAFGDIKVYTERLSFEEQAKFMFITNHFMADLMPFTVVRYHQDEKLTPSIETMTSLKVSGADKLTVAITASKLEYLIMSSSAEENRRASQRSRKLPRFSHDCEWCRRKSERFCDTCLRRQAVKATRSYTRGINDEEQLFKDLLPTDKHPADDWAIIAAMCIIKLARGSEVFPGSTPACSPAKSVQRLIQAAAILEFAHNQSKANPQISLLLVRLYSYLGAGSLAMRAYSRLRIKQVQNDTLAFILLDRISSLHPHSTSEHIDRTVNVLDPSAELEKIQRLYRGFKDQITANTWRSFECGSYDSVYQLLEASDHLSRSTTSAMSVIELRRIKRLTDPQSIMDNATYGYDLLFADPVGIEYSDKADLSSIPSYENTDADHFECYTRAGPEPSSLRTRCFLHIEELWILMSRSPENVSGKTLALIQFQESVDKIMLLRKELKKDNSSFTSYEDNLINIAFILTDIIGFVSIEHGQRPRAMDGAMVLYQRMLSAELSMMVSNLRLIHTIDSDFNPSFSSTTHPLYTAYETVSLVLAFGNFFQKTVINVDTHGPASLQTIIDQAKSARHLVTVKATEIRQQLNHGPWLNFVLDKLQHETSLPGESDGTFEWIASNVGNSLSQLVGEDFLEIFAGELVDSWRDSVMGLACLKDS